MPGHAALLPCGLLVMAGDISELHGRDRIVLNFPVLAMAALYIMLPTPGAVKDSRESLSK